MRTVLDIATLLGGLAALWFFWDRLVDVRSSTGKRQNVRLEKELQHLPSRTSRVLFLLILGTVSGAIGGLSTAILESQYGYVGAVISMLLSMGGFKFGSIIVAKFSKDAGRILTTGAGGMGFLALLGLCLLGWVMIYFDREHSFSLSGWHWLAGKGWFVILSGAVGAAYGFWAVQHNFDDPL